MVERTLVRPPSAAFGPLAPELRAALVAASPLAGRYDQALDRDSAQEMLARRAEAAAAEAARADPGRADPAAAAPGAREFTAARRYTPAAADRPAAARKSSGSRSDTVGEAFAKSFARQLGTRSGQALVRGILGGLFRGR
jgi:hypothetical protein